jgi:hypothetical protein
MRLALIVFCFLRARASCTARLRSWSAADAYAFLATHDIVPTTVLVTGDDGEAERLACAMNNTVTVVALAENTYRALKNASARDLPLMRVSKGHLMAPRDGTTLGSGGVSLRALELRHKARCDWIVLDADTAGRFHGLHTLDDGGRRAIVARFSDDEQAAERFALAAPHAWVRVRAHDPSIVMLVRHVLQ